MTRKYVWQVDKRYSVKFKGFERYYAESTFLQNQHVFQIRSGNLAADCNPIGQVSLNKRSIYVKQYTVFLNLDKMPEDLLILDEIKCNVSSPRSFRINKDTKVFYIFFPFQREKGISATVKDIYVHFIVNTFLIRSEYNKVRVEMIKHILQRRRTGWFFEIF